MKFYNVLILGCGASGSIAAIKASEKCDNIAIIDSSNKIAKKLLVTGNGRCNLTNKNVDSKKYNVNIDQYLKIFCVTDTLNFFDTLGLVTYHDEEGRYYPISNSAKSVVEVIENKIKKSNIEVYLEHKVLKIESYEDNRFLILTDKDTFICDKLVIALGGNFAQTILSDVEIKTFTPSLVSLKANVTRNLSGCRIDDVKVRAQNSLGQTKEDRGEILFKEKGISGICIFNVSTLFSRVNDFSGTLSIDLLPDFDKKQLFELLCQRRKLDVKISNFFDGLLLKQVGYEILNRIEINENRSCLSLKDEEIKKLVDVIKNLNYKVLGNLENNQVYSGGVDLTLLTNNLEHKKLKNLYFCGEACDVDGECGGYNLQWAWTSGFIVGESL